MRNCWLEPSKFQHWFAHHSNTSPMIPPTGFRCRRAATWPEPETIRRDDCSRASVYRRRAAATSGPAGRGRHTRRLRAKNGSAIWLYRCVHCVHTGVVYCRTEGLYCPLNQTTELLLGYVMFWYFTLNYVTVHYLYRPIYLFESLHFA